MSNVCEESYLLDVRRALSDSYVHSLLHVAKRFGLTEGIAFSKRELKLALEEAEIDVRALFMRRNAVDGVSEGKIAGVYAFRLSRFKIVHAHTPEALNHVQLPLLQDVVALNAVKVRILKVRMGSDRLRELAYQMSRRHANQETLGLAFDAIYQAAHGKPAKAVPSKRPTKKRAWWKFWN